MDLERQAETEAFFRKRKPEYVFLAAAKVGGIHANSIYPADFIYRNLAIQTNVINAAWQVGVKRLLFLGSTCIYPRQCPQPMKEAYLFTGPLEPTNQPYAVAKLSGIVQCEAYNRQYGTRFLAVMPSNLYGAKDNYDLLTSHVLPALIRKFHLAKLAEKNEWEAITKDEAVFGPIQEDLRSCLLNISAKTVNRPPAGQRNPVAAVSIWGTGKARREFLHVDDMADACHFLMNLDDTVFDRLCGGLSEIAPDSASLPLVNIGTGSDQTIRELADRIAPIVGYSGKVIYDPTKPDGTPRKLSDISILQSLGWTASISLEEGINRTYAWYLEQTEGN